MVMFRDGQRTKLLVEMDWRENGWEEWEGDQALGRFKVD
jgi:hypothetical protein